MKRFISLLATVILCITLGSASADRYVNSVDCNSMDEFLDAIEMGTTITANGYVDTDPYDYEMDNVEGFCVRLLLDIKGCTEKYVSIMMSKEQAQDLEEGDYITVTGTMFSRGNTGKHYYFNTQGKTGYVEEIERPEPTTLDLNEGIYNMASRVAEHRIGDIAKGEGLEIVLTQESNITSTTTYYFILKTGNILIQFYSKTKDLFKGDIIDFEGVIYNFDEPSKTLLCRDPVYQLHEDK